MSEISSLYTKTRFPDRDGHSEKITRLIIRQDGESRGAELVTMDSAGRTINIKRPLKKLYPLEVQNEPKAEQEIKITQVNNEDVEHFIKGL